MLKKLVKKLLAPVIREVINEVGREKLRSVDFSDILEKSRYNTKSCSQEDYKLFAEMPYAVRGRKILDLPHSERICAGVRLVQDMVKAGYSQECALGELRNFGLTRPLCQTIARYMKF